MLQLRVIVPLTNWKDRYEIAPWMVSIDPDATNGLSKPSAADAFQIRSVSQVRFTSRLGGVTSMQLEAIINAIRTVIGAT